MPVESAILMHSDWGSWLARWTDAGLIDRDTADRIRAFEQAQAGQRRLRWPILVALAFGALMVCGGILLFVAAHWDALSPASRFSLVLLMVAVFHAAGTATTHRFPAMSTAMHAIGTIALGAGIALAGQIFHLEEHWPGGIMLWALGAALGWWLLRDIPQMVLFALLGPAWLAGEWMVAAEDGSERILVRVLTTGTLLLAITYFTAPGAGRTSQQRRALVWIGGLAFAPLAIATAFASGESVWGGRGETSAFVTAIGTSVAIGLPLGLAFILRRVGAWPNAVAAAWILALFWLGTSSSAIPLYGWWAVGAIGLVAWGIRDGRTERINIGAATFAATVLAFYFCEVMDKLGRSASLIGLGLLFLAGGWALERARKRLVQQARGAA